MNTVNVYSIKELQNDFPEAFEKAFEKYQRMQMDWSELPWQYEIMDSMKQTFQKADVTLKGWEIGAYCLCHVKISIPTYWSELAESDLLVDDYTGKRALNWIKEAFDISSVKRVNYKYGGKSGFRYDVKKKNGEEWSCEFTGVCFDHDFLDSLLNDIQKEGCTLYEAFNNLADVAGKLFEQEYDYMISEKCFIEECENNDYQFTEDGVRIQYPYPFTNQISEWSWLY